VESLVDESNKLLDELWEKRWVSLMRVTIYVSYASVLVVRKLKGV
jgi:hypothetical protein